MTDLARDRASSDLTRRTLQLAADFGLHTVAEGVEEVDSSRSCTTSVVTRYRVSFSPGLSPWPTS